MKSWKALFSKNVISISIFISIVSYSFFLAKSNEEDLKRKGIISIGKVLGDRFIKGSHIKYFFHDKEYFKPTGLGSTKIQKIINRNFPIIYLKDDEKVNDILIFKEDFDTYNLLYPDSLKWVCDSLKLKDCK